VSTIGVIPAAGHATRLQPLRGSKEVYPIHGRPVMDYLLERLVAGGCSEIRVVTRPDKRDVIEHARKRGAKVIVARPPSPAASLVTGMSGVADQDLVLFGYPDSIWEPMDGFRRLVELLEQGSEIALGLFRSNNVERPDLVELSEAGRVTRVDVGSDAPPPHLIWGCAAARAHALRGLRHRDDPGDYFRALCRTSPVAGAVLSDRYVDIGTPRGLRIALEAPARRPEPQVVR
jgi:NDP-sugar pyrophosphorylase family protein